MVNKKKAIFLDRDGVLNNVVIEKNNKIRPPYKKKDFKVKYENILNLKKYENSYLLFIITNQPDLKKGLQTVEFNNYINNRISKLLKIKEIKTCICFEFESNCNCYKPKPQMIIDLQKKWKINLRKSFVIGDRWRDIGLGKNTKCKTIFLKQKYNINDLTLIKPDYTVNTFNNLERIIPL
ncbi:MAG: hypothetical protein CBE33_05670 [Candidatus Pelagibacter sp. TMED273]|nr:MAG: hypothetical protein CBE33_05670 [Candidatus Pelagibacter sp. TMED273]